MRSLRGIWQDYELILECCTCLLFVILFKLPCDLCAFVDQLTSFNLWTDFRVNLNHIRLRFIPLFRNKCTKWSSYSGIKFPNIQLKMFANKTAPVQSQAQLNFAAQMAKILTAINQQRFKVTLKSSNLLLSQS